MEQTNTESSKGYQVTGDVSHLGDNYYSSSPIVVSVIIDETLPPIRDWIDRPEPETQLQAWLSSDQIRLVGIVGAGGFGKSALAAHLFHQSQEFRDKFWINFQQPSRFSLFARRVLQHLHYEVDEKFTDEELATELLNRLIRGRFLLVLDNLETLLQDELWQPYQQFLTRWLGVGGGGSILYTSQEQVELPRQRYQLWPLAGLSVEQGLALLKRQGVAGNKADLTEFVSVAEGHPLLLNLAIDWLLDPEQEIGERKLSTDAVTLFKTIVGQHRGDTAASVGKVFEASFQRLTPRLQHLLMDVSVYRRGFSLAAAQAMLPNEAEPLTIAELRSLEKCSLLLKQADGHNWQFQPLIKRYVEYLRRKIGNVPASHERAIVYYHTIAKPQVQPTDTREAVHEELEIFYHHCELHQYSQALEMISGCDDFLSLRGYNKDLVQLYEQLWQSWQPKETEQKELSTLLSNLGLAHYLLGHYEQAIACHKQSLAIKRQVEDRGGEAKSLNNLGIAYYALGQYEQAIAHHKQSLEIKRQVGDIQGEASSLGNLGNVYSSLGRYEQAIELYQQSLAIERRGGDIHGEVNSLNGLGSVYASLGQYEQAIDLLQQSLEIKRQIGDIHGKAISLGNLGNAYFSLGRYEQAIALYQKSIDIQRQVGNIHYEAMAFFNLGNAMAKLDQRLEAAIPAYQHARRLYQEMGRAKDVENCDIAIREVGQVIAARPRKAPGIGTKLPETSDWHAQSLPTPAKSHPPHR
ncbi:MAG TPA: tetratricopeptide repeat protein, partial [Candidatus Obscuribacterales bacterium]